VNDSRPKNYYDVLEVSQDAKPEEIEQGYLRSKNAFSGESLAMYSLMSNDECEQMLVQIDEAYSILSVPEKRKQYDAARGLNKDHHNPEMLYQQSAHDKPNTQHQGQAQNYQSHVREAQTSQQVPQQASKQYGREESYKMNRGNEVEVSRLSANRRFNLNYAQSPEFEQEIENATVFDGEFLKRIREYKQVSVQRMSEMTKISKNYIAHIESENLEGLPALVYIRGFVYQYAKCLKLNPDLVANSFAHLVRTKEAQSASA